MKQHTTRIPVDLVINGGSIVTGGYTIPKGWIAVNDGKIVAIGSNEGYSEAKKTIDATGKYVLPGFVDPEQHPAAPIEDHITPDTSAAVATGITTAGMMAISNRIIKKPRELRTAEDVPSHLEAIPEFIELMNQKSMIDYFMTPCLTTPRLIREIPDLAEKLGITSFKIYLHYKTGEHLHDMSPLMKRRGDFYYDDGDIYWAMTEVAALGSPGILCFHCENWEIARVRKERLIAQGRDEGALREGIGSDEYSSAFCEAGHVRNYSYYARITGCPIYIVHCTTRETLEEIKEAKAAGVNITGQAGPHYLTVTKDTGMSINVPLRSGADFEKLWEALRTGVLDCLGTDSVWRTDSGIRGFMLPVMLSEGVNKGRISLERLVQVGCENNAKTFGIFPKKGTIAIGSDADFVIVDLNKSKTLTRDMVLSHQGRPNSKGPELPEWKGWELPEWELKGWPVMTIVRGNIQMEWPEDEPRWKIVGKPVGQYIRRPLSMS